MATHQSWFEVDPAGLRELFGGLSPARLVLELIQNVWDEASTTCEVLIRDGEQDRRRVTEVTVTDDNPEGFSNLAHAYTLFGSTSKRSDPTKRGRFNLGEKLVIARSLSSRITTTKGTVLFDRQGRHAGRTRREAGSEVHCIFPRWKPAETDEAFRFLRQLIPPQSIKLTLNGEHIPSRVPELVHPANLPTVILTAGDEGVSTMSRTARNTTLALFPVSGRAALLFEMGIPVCEIAGNYDVSVAQKIPLQTERATVTPSYLQDIYAEMIRALGPKLDLQALGTEIVQLALRDERIDPAAARATFTQLFGESAAIQSHNPDSDQEAARHGCTLVSSRTFGADVNEKLRAGGVQTTHDLYGRDRGKELAKVVPDDELNDTHRNFIAYVRMLVRELYGDGSFSVSLGRWEHSRAIAFNAGGNSVMFHIGRVSMVQPVSRTTSLILHELAHCKGDGHDGVYDNEFERLVDSHTCLLARRPDLYRPFEPQLFA